MAVIVIVDVFPYCSQATAAKLARSCAKITHATKACPQLGDVLLFRECALSEYVLLSAKNYQR